MKSIKFPGATIAIGAGQEDTYNTLHAMRLPGDEVELIMCFELTEEEIQKIVETKRIYYHRLTFGTHFQPMRLSAGLDDGIELTWTKE